MCWLWFYKAVNPPLRKADHLSLAQYKLGQKHGRFLWQSSQIIYLKLLSQWTVGT